MAGDSADAHAKAIVGRMSRWVPGTAAVANIARRVRRGTLELHFPDGTRERVLGPEPGPEADLRLNNGRLARRLLFGGTAAFGESYARGDWDSRDVTRLLLLLDLNRDVFDEDGVDSSLLGRVAARLKHALRANTIRGSRRNIHAHYDLGNEFFAAWLDQNMLYSSALFDGKPRDLAAAQLAKCRELACSIDLHPGQRLLEIGSGWGTFALLAAKEFGARVTSITISREQYEHARRRVFEEKLGEQVDIRLEDYRNVDGRFDRIASIEMFEAVGEAYWPIFFARLRARLTDAGRAGLQIITIADERFAAYRRSPDFIQRYIFPGGMLPSLAALAAQYERAGLAEVGRRAFAHDYARTLEEWRERFDAAWPRIAPLGFDEYFRRLWRYYLAYCEAGFRSGAIDVVQTVVRPAGA
jgi:cyclopropane-fatty-acyl-phospholipid synthase